MLSRVPPFAIEQTEHQAIAAAARALASAERVLVLTGAGMSADSGLPTYRGVGGLYEQDITPDGVDIEDALSGEMFRQDPALTWKYICQIEAACRDARPHAGHAVLARWQQHWRHMYLVTQNVDGLHRAAGSSDVIEMHGRVHRLVCTGCDRVTQVADFSDFQALPPQCYLCGSVLRPAVVLFGERLPMHAAMRYEIEVATGFDALIAVGTSGVFPYIVEPFRDAFAHSVPTIEINPRATEMSRFCSTSIRMPAVQALTAIEAELKK